MRSCSAPVGCDLELASTVLGCGPRRGGASPPASGVCPTIRRGMARPVGPRTRASRIRPVGTAAGGARAVHALRGCSITRCSCLPLTRRPALPLPDVCGGPSGPKLRRSVPTGGGRSDDGVKEHRRTGARGDDVATDRSGSTSCPATTASAARQQGRAHRRSSRVPTTNISIAKPISARKATVGSRGSSHPAPLGPRATPAMTSPTTSGSPTRGSAASNGPARPASTTSVSRPGAHPGWLLVHRSPIAVGSPDRAGCLRVRERPVPRRQVRGREPHGGRDVEDAGEHQPGRPHDHGPAVRGSSSRSASSVRAVSWIARTAVPVRYRAPVRVVDGRRDRSGTALAALLSRCRPAGSCRRSPWRPPPRAVDPAA